MLNRLVRWLWFLFSLCFFRVVDGFVFWVIYIVKCKCVKCQDWLEIRLSLRLISTIVTLNSVQIKCWNDLTDPRLNFPCFGRRHGRAREWRNSTLTVIISRVIYCIISLLIKFYATAINHELVKLRNEYNRWRYSFKIHVILICTWILRLSPSVIFTHIFLYKYSIYYLFRKLNMR